MAFCFVAFGSGRSNPVSLLQAAPSSDCLQVSRRRSCEGSSKPKRSGCWKLPHLVRMSKQISRRRTHIPKPPLGRASACGLGGASCGGNSRREGPDVQRCQGRRRTAGVGTQLSSLDLTLPYIILDSGSHTLVDRVGEQIAGETRPTHNPCCSRAC